ncbi:MAG: hypothetical protein HUU38_13945 [Anaerolineales bacterium]|nr:hypothetical protein [Anaerolineales bacterium]
MMRVQNNILTIEEKPDWFQLGIPLAALWGLFFLMVLREKGALFLGLVLLVLTGYFLFTTHTIRCVLDKNTRSLSYTQIGLFGNVRKQATCLFLQVRSVQIKRYVARQRDRFECRLSVGDREILPLSQPMANLPACERFARQVHTFLEIQRPVSFLD